MAVDEKYRIYFQAQLFLTPYVVKCSLLVNARGDRHEEWRDCGCPDTWHTERTETGVDLVGYLAGTEAVRLGYDEETVITILTSTARSAAKSWARNPVVVAAESIVLCDGDEGLHATATMNVAIDYEEIDYGEPASDD